MAISMVYHLVCWAWAGRANHWYSSSLFSLHKKFPNMSKIFLFACLQAMQEGASLFL